MPKPKPAPTTLVFEDPPRPPRRYHLREVDGMWEGRTRTVYGMEEARAELIAHTGKWAVLAEEPAGELARVILQQRAWSISKSRYTWAGHRWETVDDAANGAASYRLYVRHVGPDEA